MKLLCKLLSVISLVAILTAGQTAWAQDDDAEASTGVDFADDTVSHLGTSGAGLYLGLGPFATFRRMTLEGSLRDIEHVPGLYVGALIDLGLQIATLGEFGTLGLVARGGFSSSQSTDTDPTIGRKLVTEHNFINVHLALDRPVLTNFDLRFLIGGGATSFTVEPNARYTGHQYITANFGVLAVFWFGGETARISTGVIAKPALLTNQSDDADGPGRGFGLNGTFEFGYRVYQPVKGDMANVVEAIVGYDANYFHTSFPLSGRVGADPTSTDLAHMGMLSIQYHL